MKQCLSHLNGNYRLLISIWIHFFINQNNAASARFDVIVLYWRLSRPDSRAFYALLSFARHRRLSSQDEEKTSVIIVGIMRLTTRQLNDGSMAVWFRTIASIQFRVWLFSLSESDIRLLECDNNAEFRENWTREIVLKIELSMNKTCFTYLKSFFKLFT